MQPTKRLARRGHRNRATRLLGIAVAATIAPIGQTVRAQTLPTETETISVTPLPGSGVAASGAPEAVATVGARDIDRTDVPDLTQALVDDIPGVSINGTSGNDFQPDILFRGYTASPVAGTAEGLAVYVDGARFNDPFGDTVNWDLLPTLAIDTVTVTAANPLYGLNALGGAVNVRLKTGFTFDGADITAYGGTFARGAGLAEYGATAGDTAFYAAGEVLSDGGYRQTQATSLYNLYTDLAWRDGASEIDLGLGAASDLIGNPGAAPVQVLDVAPSAVFTAPNTVSNKYLSATLNGRHQISDALSLQGTAYIENLTQRISNGATQDGGPCVDVTGIDNGDLCNDDGTVVTTYGGAAVPDFLHGATYSALVTEGLDTQGYGAAGQATLAAAIAGLPNHAVFGASFDGSDATYNGQTAIGGFIPSTGEFVGPPDDVQVQPSEGVEPVKVATVTRYYGVFAADTLHITPQLAATAAVRFNDDTIGLFDKRGTALDGQHYYDSVDRQAGLTYTVLPGVQAYGGYAETNRAPTPTELSCASAATPCSLLNFFIGDPNLKQVIAQTWSAGVRGGQHTGIGRIDWSLDYFHSDDRDDLIYETAANNPNLAYYTNAGRSTRQGPSASVKLTTGRLTLTADYAYTDAVYDTDLLINSGSNPSTDANGNEHVVPGDHIPGIPAERGGLVAEYQLLPWWRLGGSAVFSGAQWRFGDEANREKQVGGYVVLGLDTQVTLLRNVSLFGTIQNLTDRRYDTYGSFGPVDEVPFPEVPGGVADPRTASPGQPFTVYGGVKVTL